MSALSDVRESLVAGGQGHVFQFADELDQAQQDQLAAQVKRIDLNKVSELFSAASAPASSHQAEISPFKAITDCDQATEAEVAEWRRIGLDMIASGGAALILMAGGQGTRLGFHKPKGQYDIGLPSHKSLFQLHAERLLRVRQLAAQHKGVEVGEVSLPWYIMTSLPTHQDTVDFFEANSYFGVPKDDVFFFQQALLPCLTNEGKVILQTKTELAWAPNGNGGIFAGLRDSGALADMKKRGAEYAHIFCVDNALVSVGDPVYLGHAKQQGAEVSNKVCKKRSAHERVGVMCLRDGKPGVVEYSEISTEMAEQTSADGQDLTYGAANVAIHCLSVPFLEKCANTQLPYHVARKQIPFCGPDGVTVKPAEKNGVKLEMFFFDVFEWASKCVAFQVPREDEFAPVKNAPGDGVNDSPDTARALLSAQARRWISGAGGEVVGDGDCEVSALVSYAGEDLETRCKGQRFQTPVHIH